MNKHTSAEKSNQEFWAKHAATSPIFYPDERLVAMLSAKRKKWSSDANPSGLDIGFGSGRHLKLMIDLKVNAYGIEYNRDAIEATRLALGSTPYVKDMWLGDYRSFDFPRMFDIMIAWGVLFLAPQTEIEQSLRKLSRSLSDDGSLYINFRTKDNWFYRLGDELAPDTYLLDERAGPLAGTTYTFLEFPEIQDLLTRSGLKIQNAERVDLWKNNCQEQNSWYLCEVTRA